MQLALTVKITSINIPCHVSQATTVPFLYIFIFVGADYVALWIDASDSIAVHAAQASKQRDITANGKLGAVFS